MENEDNHTGGEGNAMAIREFEGSVRPVSPGDSGGGLPYAPEDWPNPGDMWVWRVGRRISKKSGTFHDRYLRLPHSLSKGQKKPLEFQSKPAVERYLRSHFPDADICAFFASFTWVIRAKPELIGTYVYTPTIKRSPVKKLIKNKNSGVGDKKRMRGAVRIPKVEMPCRNDHECINHSVGIASNGEETRIVSSTRLASSSLVRSHVSGDFNGSQADPHTQEFDNYLDNLDEILESPTSMKEGTKESRKKLSSLLARTTPNCLLTSEDSNELIALSYKLQNDPNLSKEELSILKLIQSIPFISKSFLEAKEISSKADEFFCGLNTKIATVASLKEEYDASKKEIKDVKANEASALLNLKWIDQKLLKLEKLKQEEADRVEVYREKLIRLNSVQKMVMGTLPKVVDEVQIAKSETSIWELKKKKAVELEAEILARFAPLDGFSF